MSLARTLTKGKSSNGKGYVTLMNIYHGTYTIPSLNYEEYQQSQCDESMSEMNEEANSNSSLLSGNDSSESEEESEDVSSSLLPKSRVSTVNKRQSLIKNLVRFSTSATLSPFSDSYYDGSKRYALQSHSIGVAATDSSLPPVTSQLDQTQSRRRRTPLITTATRS